MLQYKKIDVSQGIDIDKTSLSKVYCMCVTNVTIY